MCKGPEWVAGQGGPKKSQSPHGWERSEVGRGVGGIG